MKNYNPAQLNELEESAKKYGLDLSLTYANLELSLDERLIRHQQALNLMMEMQRAGEKYYERLEQTLRTPHSK